MVLVDLLKSILGRDSDDESSGSRDGDRPDAAGEAAVKGTEAPAADETEESGAGDTEASAAAGGDATASTGSLTEEPPSGEQGDDETKRAAEPAEAAGPASQRGDTSPDVTEDETDAASDETDVPEDQRDANATAGTSAEPELTSVRGIGPAYAERLNEAGVDSVADLRDADAAELADATGVSEKRVADWIDNARDV